MSDAAPQNTREHSEIWKTNSRMSLKRVTARGKRYVYERASGVAIVKGFVGTDAELDEAIAVGLNRPIPVRPKRRLLPTLAGWRADTAKVIHKITKGRAIQKGRAYDLTPELITERLRAAKDRCEVTGIEFDYWPKTEAAWRIRPFAPSLDRIDNKVGYEPKNVRLVCACVNYAINEFGLETFDRVCRALVAKNGACQ